MTLEGYIPSTFSTTMIERLLMPTLTDVMVTLLGLIIVVATVLAIHLLRGH